MNRYFLGGAALAATGCFNWAVPTGTLPDAGDETDGSLGADAPDALVDAAATCAPDKPCGPGAYCHYTDLQCGSGVASGACVPQSECVSTGSVCGCNGQVYSSDCAAKGAGNDVSVSATCTAPPATFRCGDGFCATTDYCVVSDGGLDYSCTPLGLCVLGCACPAVASACPNETCSTSSGGVRVTCP